MGALVEVSVCPLYGHGLEPETIPTDVPVAHAARRSFEVLDAIALKVLRLAILCLLALTACDVQRQEGSSERSQAVRYDSAGIEVVINNDSTDRTLGWSFERVFDLGSVEQPATAFHQLPDQAAVFDTVGRLYVLDAGNHRIVVFDAEGRHVRSFGQEGRGPGHLDNPVAIWLRGAGDTIEVLDWAQGTVVRFTADGEALETRPAPVSAGIDDQVRPFPAGLVTTLQRGFRDRAVDSTVVSLVQASRGDTTSLALISRVATSPSRFRSCNLRIWDRPVFEPSLVWDARGRWAAVATSVEYRIRWLVGREVRRIIVRTSPPRPVTAEDAAAELRHRYGEGPESKIEMADCPVDAAEWVQKRGYRPRLQPVDRIRIDPRGRLWIRRNAVAGKGPIDVIDADGAYLGTLSPDAPYPVAFASTTRFVATSVDELGIPHVTVYRILTERSG